MDTIESGPGVLAEYRDMHRAVILSGSPFKTMMASGIVME